jgi:hypothetical protein
MVQTLILINQIGYDTGSRKRLIFATSEPAPAGGEFHVLREDGERVHTGVLRAEGTVDGWRGRYFQSGDFSVVDSPGRYTIESGAARSASFEIGPRLVLARTLVPVLSYFRSQRSREPWDSADRRCKFFGETRAPVDVHGGWHDASGDVSKYLSHLSYANFMNPQQSPIVVYNLLWAETLLAAGDTELRRLMIEEAAHGGDFLVRMQDPAGYFYTTVFDGGSKDPQAREICSFERQDGHKSTRYRAGYRQGGGAAVAALARLAASGHRGEYGPAEYLAAAVRGFDHLEQHSVAYLDDGRENIIDDYTALLAAAELFAATREPRHAEAAQRRAARLAARLRPEARPHGSFYADDAGQRPFFHAVEAGLPVLALLRWAELFPAERARLHRVVATALALELEVTGAVVNPFGHARQVVKPVSGPIRTSFFFPHDNESGYWWQGENARLGSLAAAATLASSAGAVADERLHGYAQDQVDWILGRNPFDACLLHGFGRHNVNYQGEWPNYFGGITNGITAGLFDEADIEFAPTEGPGAEGEHAWRWTEQWLPHAAWFLLAVTAMAARR